MHQTCNTKICLLQISLIFIISLLIVFLLLYINAKLTNCSNRAGDEVITVATPERRNSTERRLSAERRRSILQDGKNQQQQALLGMTLPNDVKINIMGSVTDNRKSSTYSPNSNAMPNAGYITTESETKDRPEENRRKPSIESRNNNFLRTSNLEYKKINILPPATDSDTNIAGQNLSNNQSRVSTKHSSPGISELLTMDPNAAEKLDKSKSVRRNAETETAVIRSWHSSVRVKREARPRKGSITCTGAGMAAYSAVSGGSKDVKPREIIPGMANSLMKQYNQSTREKRESGNIGNKTQHERQNEIDKEREKEYEREHYRPSEKQRLLTRSEIEERNREKRESSSSRKSKDNHKHEKEKQKQKEKEKEHKKHQDRIALSNTPKKSKRTPISKISQISAPCELDLGSFTNSSSDLQKLTKERRSLREGTNMRVRFDDLY